MNEWNKVAYVANSVQGRPRKTSAVRLDVAEVLASMVDSLMTTKKHLNTCSEN